MNVVLKLSKLCNLRCVYCYEYEHLADSRRMPLECLARLFESLAQQYLEAGWQGELSFALHGGEPLLLPPEYLRALVELQRKHLGAQGIAFRNSVQTNLYRVRPGTLELLEELGIGLGVSVDVFGGQRVDAQGRDAEEPVRRALRQRVEEGWPRRLRMGGISVLHAGNVSRAAEVFDFFSGLGLDYRILPIFSMADPPSRMRHLMLPPDRVVEALKAVFRARLRTESTIRIYPLEDYLEAAVRHSGALPRDPYDPALREWALIVDTDGGAYTHGEAYNPAFRLGNVFDQPLGSVLGSEARGRLNALRAKRGQACDACEFGSSCSRIPMIEAVPSERSVEDSGRPRCAVARPMIAWLSDLMGSVPAARAVLAPPLAGRAPSTPAAGGR